MLARRAGDREHIVEAHADVGHRDRPGGGGEALRGLEPRMLVALDLGRPPRMRAFAQFAPHLPRDPDQQQAADEDQPDDLHQLRDDKCESDAQDERRVRIALTPQGLGLRDQAERIPHCVLESSQCTLPELVALTSQLKNLRERLSQR